MKTINKFKFAAFSIVVLLGTTSCKEVSKNHGGENSPEVITGKNSAEFYASSASQLRENGKFFFSVYKSNFSTNIDFLPMEGIVAEGKRPSTGFWYPEKHGGTNVVVSGNRTPLQKYDDAFNGGQNKAAKWEKEKHSKNGSWYGHCNGYSAATQRYPEEPRINVEHNGITFTPKDIKALLAEIHMSADFIFLGGGRCETNNLGRPSTRSDPTVMGVCEDINPGTLHAAVTNWIGRQEHTLIMDSFGGEEVWNYPYYQYKVTKREGISRAAATSKVGSSGSNYIFNPAAASFVEIALELTYADAAGQEVLQQRNAKKMYLEYILELDGSNNIIGGEWVGNSQSKHPDFLWVALPPLEPNGTEYMSNEFVKIEEVIKLWAKSTENDPDNPPSDIVRPEPIEVWGRFPDFEVTLDSGQRGAVFAGKPAVLKVERKGTYQDPAISLELSMDGKHVARFDGSGSAGDFSKDLNPGLGLHRLALEWTKNGEKVSNETLLFHVVR